MGNFWGYMRLLFLEKKKRKKEKEHEKNSLSLYSCKTQHHRAWGRTGGGLRASVFFHKGPRTGGSGGGVPAAHQRGPDRPPGEQSPSSLDAPAPVPQSRPQPRCPSEVPTRSPGERGSPLVHSFLPGRESRTKQKKFQPPPPPTPTLE